MSEIAAIVLNWKDQINTKNCVNSLLKIEAIEKIIIVHNEAKSSCTEPFFENSPLITEIFVSENRGFSGGINVGISKALTLGYHSILLLNNDATIDQSSVKQLLKIQRENPGSLVSPLIRNPDGSVQFAGAKLHTFSLRINEKSFGEVDFLTFACVLIEAEVFSKIGLLNENFFMYWEDVDFSLRAKKSGFPLIITKGAEAIHAVSSSRKIAGSRVDLYSAFGLGAFGILHPLYKFGSYYRIALRVLKRVVMLQFSFAYKLWKAFRDGQKLDGHSYLKVTKENWPL